KYISAIVTVTIFVVVYGGIYHSSLVGVSLIMLCGWIGGGLTAYYSRELKPNELQRRLLLYAGFFISSAAFIMRTEWLLYDWVLNGNTTKICFELGSLLLIGLCWELLYARL